MVLPRPTALRGVNASRFVRSVPRTPFRAVARRGYASGHGGHSEPSSDMPWLISAVAVTIPSCYFLWPESHEGAVHGAEVMTHAGTHTEEEAEEQKDDEAPVQEPKEDETPKEDESKDEEPKEEAPKEEKSEEKSEDDSSSSGGKPDTTEPEKVSNQKVDGVQFKGKTGAGDENNEMTDERKREPDSKGAFKKRIDSGYQKDLGPGESAKAPSDNPGDITNKQKGLSTTPTRHSTDIHNNPEKSKKGEGAPETAKLMGPVDPNRPQAESSDRKDRQEKKDE